MRIAGLLALLGLMFLASDIASGQDTLKQYKKGTGRATVQSKAPAGLQKEKRKLMRQRKYECCIVDPCDACVEDGGCKCKEAVKKNKAVCGECYDAWQRGEGDVPEKTAKEIKKGHGH